MAAKQLATKIDEKVKEALDHFCEERGLKIGRFVEDAILDKLEEYEDLSELKKLRNESFKAFDEVLKELKSNGKL
jgi:antitoxin component of RelBE/YafQ-DinJ toxin-antitoxin module